MLPTHRNCCLRIVLLIHQAGSPGIIYTLNYYKKCMHMLKTKQTQFCKAIYQPLSVSLTRNDQYYQSLVYSPKDILWIEKHTTCVMCEHIHRHTKPSPFSTQMATSCVLCTCFVFILLNIWVFCGFFSWQHYIYTPTLFFWLHNIK